MKPRCAKPMRRYEPAGWPPVFEDPMCARPEDHNGPCRSPRSYQTWIWSSTRMRDRQARARRAAAGGLA